MLPYIDRLRSQTPTPRTVHKGLDKFAHGGVGRWARRSSKSNFLFHKAEQIADKSKKLSDLEELTLLEDYENARRLFQYSQGKPEYVDDLLAIICEFCHRALGMRPYPVQVMGALVLHQGMLAEMATGEGKSLTTGMGATLMACLGKPVHVLSSNDYLAGRDCEEMQPLFQLAGFSSAAISGESEPPERKAAYGCDIVYTTGKELLGDFLRDRLALGAKVSDISRSIEHLLLSSQDDGLTMRGLYCVLVDEADSVLIDEAVTPLILSVPRENNALNEATLLAQKICQEFVPPHDYTVDLRYREILWTKKGQEKLKQLSHQLPLMWQGHERSEEILSLALQAKELFLRDEHYIVQDGKIVLLDTLTGRLTPNRNLGIGLQQAVEAKEELEINPPTETLARFSYQKFFRLIPHLAGMSGTVKEAAVELWQIYYLSIVKIPTHRKVMRKILDWKLYQDQDLKITALVAEACQVSARGQSVLIGTRTVDQSETIAEKIRDAGYTCDVLNAVRFEEEADIIKRAGAPGALTIATNMAGRGTDIKLSQAVKEKGGLYVISLEPQDSARVDRQLFGRSGRQGDPGCVRVYVSLEDALLKRFSSIWMRWLFAKISFLTPKIIISFVGLMQKTAERHAMKQRLSILKSDDWYENYLSFPGAQRSSKKGKEI